MAVANQAPRTRAVEKPQKRKADLRVVRANEHVRTASALGTIIVSIMMAVLLMLAGLHAILVQTQAQLDSIDTEIAQLAVRRNEGLAELAWHDSPKGLAAAAAAAGLVHATDRASLAPVAEGALAPPSEVNPFGGASG